MKYNFMCSNGYTLDPTPVSTWIPGKTISMESDVPDHPCNTRHQGHSQNQSTPPCNYRLTLIETATAIKSSILVSMYVTTLTWHQINSVKLIAQKAMS